MNFLRLVGAALFVLIVLVLAGMLFMELVEDPGFGVAEFLLLLVGVVTVWAAMKLFGSNAPPVAIADEDLESTSFRARRAFEVEEFEDEGRHFFIELEDGSVLFLSGQYLYDYEAFPCTSFVVRRHARKRYVVDVLCEGDVIEPDILCPPFTTKDYEADAIPEDGQIFADVSYEKLKADRMRPSA